MFYTKRYQILCKKRISMLTAFKKSSLASKCVFYRTEHKANGRPRKWDFEVLRMQRWDKPTDKAQRVDEKMGLIWWLLKCITWLFFVFSVDDTKKLVTVWTKHLSATERSSWVNMVIRQRTPFFSSTLWAISVGTFHFCMSRPSKFSSMGPPICFMFCSVKSTFLHTKDDYLKSDMKAQTRHLCHSVCVFVGGGRVRGSGGCWMNPLIKRIVMTKFRFR